MMFGHLAIPNNNNASSIRKDFITYTLASVNRMVIKIIRPLEGPYVQPSNADTAYHQTDNLRDSPATTSYIHL